jgi:hypothetical protein
VSEERVASTHTVKKIVLLGTASSLSFIANTVLSSPILVTLKMEAINSSKMFVVTRDTLRNIPAEGILLSHFR